MANSPIIPRSVAGLLRRIGVLAGVFKLGTRTSSELTMLRGWKDEGRNNLSPQDIVDRPEDLVEDHPLLKDKLFVHCPQLLDSNLTALYQIGSRVYFTNKQGADWDFIAVARDYYGPEMFVGGDEQFSFEITIFDEKRFIRQVEHHTLFVLAAVFVPKQFIWRRFHDYSRHLHVEYPRLRMSAKFEADFSLKKAARKWKKGDPYKGKKNFIAGLRFVQFALQLVERQCIYNFQCANAQWTAISENQSTKLDDYMNIYKPMILDAMNQLRDITRPAPLPPGVPPAEPPSLFVCEFARIHGLDALSRYYCIRSVPVLCDSDVQLRLLSPDRIYGWFRRIPLREAAAGLIIRLPELSVVAYGAGADLPELGGKFESASAAEDPRSLLADSEPGSTVCRRVYAFPWGRVVNLFWHAGQWRIFTDQHPTAAEPLADHAADLHLSRITLGYTRDVSLSSAFWQAWKTQGCTFPDWEHARECTWQLVLSYATAEITLVGVRLRDSLHEEEPLEAWAGKCKWRPLKRLSALEGLTVSAATAQLALLPLDPLRYIGAAGIDENFTHHRIVSLQHQSLTHTLLYCDSHWRREEMPWKEGRSRSKDPHAILDAILHVIQNDVEGDGRAKCFVAMFPEWAEMYASLQSDLEAYCAAIQQSYEESKHLPLAEYMTLVGKLVNARRPLLTRLYNRAQEGHPTTARRLLVTPQLNTSLSKTLASDNHQQTRKKNDGSSM